MRFISLLLTLITGHDLLALKLSGSQDRRRSQKQDELSLTLEIVATAAHYSGQQLYAANHNSSFLSTTYTWQTLSIRYAVEYSVTVL